MSFWEQPGTSDWLLGGYFGLLSFVWIALIVGGRSWGERWRVHRLALDTELGEAKDLLVSICIPARNEAENIEGCVRAALQTRWSNLEVIVVDDRSDDGTAEVAAKAGEGDPRLHIFSGGDVKSARFPFYSEKLPFQFQDRACLLYFQAILAGKIPHRWRFH